MVPGMFSGQRLFQIEKALQKHIIGQSEAIGAVSRVIRRAGIGIGNSNSPIGSFLFAGPLGVGKTLLAKSLAIERFGSKESIIKLNMNEYTENDSVSTLTETVQNRPHSVILLHDIHKAHHSVLKAMIQILRDGRLTDNKGITVHFNKNIIIMTSSSAIGYHRLYDYSDYEDYSYSDDDDSYDDSDDDDGDSDDDDDSTFEKSKDNLEKDLERILGSELFNSIDDDDSTFEKSKDNLEKDLERMLGSELFNSIDEVVVFKQLGVSELKEIVETMIKEVCEKLIKTKNIKLTVTENFKEKLAKEAYGDNKCLNRVVCLKKAFRRLVLDNITMGILNERVKEGAVTMDIDSFGNVHYFYPPCISVA